MSESGFCIFLVICALSGVAYIIWRIAKDKVMFREEADRNSQKCLAALSEIAERIGMALSELAQKTESISEACTRLAVKSEDLQEAASHLGQAIEKVDARTGNCLAEVISASGKQLTALSETEARIGKTITELAQKTGSIDETCSELAAKSSELLAAQERVAQAVAGTRERVEACSESVALAHGLLAAAALRDASGENDLEKVIGEGDVQKHISCQSRQRILLVTDKATGSETQYIYQENGQIGSETRVQGKLKFSVAFSPDGVPTEGFVFGDGEKPMQKFVYDDYGQVKERVAL